MQLASSIDLLSREKMSGWAWDSERPETPVSVVISAGDQVIARCLADRHRPDVADAGFGNGRCGFEYFLPRPLSSLRTHEISLRREGDGAHLAGSPQTLSPPTSLDMPTRLGIETLVGSLEEAAADDALAFFALQTERLRTVLADRQSGAWSRERRRGLGWQEHGSSPASAASPVIAVPRVLVIDDHIPAGDHDGGADAILSHMRVLRRLGYDVTFVPANLAGDPAALSADGIATCLHPWYASVEDVLRRQAGAFQLVYLHRITNAARYIGLARQYQPGAKLVYSVADLHFLRSARQARVESRPELARLSERQRVAEFAAALQSDGVITHSSYEAAILRAQLPSSRIHLVPWTVKPRPTEEPFASRRGVAFIAHYAHQPNADAARALLEDIMPEVWAADASFPCLLAGSGLPNWLRDLAKPPAEALGAIPDLASLFGRVRLSVAPLFFGAGIKGKVMASLAAGIPCVCTSIAAEGLDLPPPLDELIADEPAAIAALILRLDRDEEYNAHCAAAGLEYVAERFSEGAIDNAMEQVIRSS